MPWQWAEVKDHRERQLLLCGERSWSWTDGSELTARKSELLQEMKSDGDAMVQEWIAALPELTVNRTVESSAPK